MKIFEKISNWIENQIPQSVKVSECVIREVIAVHELEICNCVNTKERAAIGRLKNQIEYSGTCSHQVHTYILYKQDKAAIRRMLNNYCLYIAERHSQIRCKVFKKKAFEQYEKYTLMMKLFY